MHADEQFRHECEVRWCVSEHYPDGERMAAHLDLVTRRRGKVAADRLRADVRKAWAIRREQARDERIKAEVRAGRVVA